MATKKKSSAIKHTPSPRTAGQTQRATAKTSSKKKSAAKKKPPPSRTETPQREGAMSILKGFLKKRRVRSLFALETKEDLQQKTVAELRAVAREAGIGLKGRLKAEMAEEIAEGLGLFPKARKKPSGRVKKPSPAGKKAAPTGKRVIRPARPILKETPAARVKELEEAPLVEMALGTALAEGEPEGIVVAPFPKDMEVVTRPAPGKVPEKIREFDRVTAVAVDPHTMFVNWDITGRTAERGKPTVRVYDVTGVAFGGEKQHAFRDVKLSGTSGECFIEATPGREYIVDAGVTDARGRFMPARRTSMVTMPPEAPPEGRAVLSREYFRFRPGEYGNR